MVKIDFIGRSFPKEITNVVSVLGFTSCGLSIICIYVLVIGWGLPPFSDQTHIPQIKNRIIEPMVQLSSQSLTKISIQPKGTNSFSTERDEKKEHQDRIDNSYKELIFQFDGAGYQWEIQQNINYLVPRVFVNFLPSDFADIPSVSKRKKIFIAIMLPLILAVNEEILFLRNRLLDIEKDLNKGWEATPQNITWLSEVEARYEISPGDYKELIKRMDVVPPSLALAQAAEESGWGTSRFAREGNALFGLYTYDINAGIRPSRRDDGERHLIETYNSLFQSVRTYVHNLNYHSAYTNFREERYKLRTKGQVPDGFILAAELLRYSQRREDYVKAIQEIITSNQLSKLDLMQLVTYQDDR